MTRPLVILDDMDDDPISVNLGGDLLRRQLEMTGKGKRAVVINGRGDGKSAELQR